MIDNMEINIRWSNLETDIKNLGFRRLDNDLAFQILMNKLRSELISLLAFKLNFCLYNGADFKTTRNTLHACINELNEKYCTSREKQTLLELGTFIDDIFEDTL